ncbi:MAG: uL30 family ribosomal protein [archaeon]
MAIVLVRGLIGIRKNIKDTLFMLRLRKKHTCVVVDKNKSSMGMIFKVKDYVTYGEVDDATVKELEAKRGKKGKKFYALSPPKGGFERRGIKTSFTRKGALGYRGNKINDLIKRML